MKTRLIFVCIMLCVGGGHLKAPPPNPAHRVVRKNNDDSTNGNLIFATVIFRHGDRTPVDPYPTDPYRNPDDWPVGFGQLTNTGKMQHYELGKWLRKRYDELINITYSRNDIYIRSTDVDRTLMSALANLAGFFPPEGTDVWNPNLQWQPIAIHTVPEELDYVLAAKKPCPAYNFALKKLLESDEFKQLNKKYKELYDYLTKHTGKVVHSLESAQFIYSCLKIETIYNKTLPDWTSEVFPHPLKEISDRSFATKTYTRHMARLKSGPLLREILQRFQNKTQAHREEPSKQNRAMWVYSAHDNTVANFLNTMGVFEYHSPPYAACIMLELRTFDGVPHVQLYYKNTTGEPMHMIIPNCGASCPLDKMFEVYNDVLPVDWEAECEMSTLAMSYEDANMSTPMEMAIALLIICFIVTAAWGCALWCRRRDYNNSDLYVRVG